MEEAVKRTRDELVEYVREQRRVSVLSGPSILPLAAEASTHAVISTHMLWCQGLDKCLRV